MIRRFQPTVGNPYGVIAWKKKTRNTISSQVKKLIHDIRRKGMEQQEQKYSHLRHGFDAEAYLSLAFKPKFFPGEPERTAQHWLDESDRVMALADAIKAGKRNGRPS
jgi:hypothetical protein